MALPNEDGEQVLEGVLWRGIGPAAGTGYGRHYTVQHGKAVFRIAAFYDSLVPHPDDSKQKHSGVSFVLGAFYVRPEDAREKLGALQLQNDALAGVPVEEVINRTELTPTASGHPNLDKEADGLPILQVIYRPVPNPEELPGHVEVHPLPPWQSRKKHDRIRTYLARLATHYLARHGWVLAPAEAA